MKELFGILFGGFLGALPGLIVGYLSWVPLRLWLFSQIPPEVQWAFWAKLVSCLVILFTVGGSFTLWLLFVGGILGVKIAAEMVK